MRFINCYNGKDHNESMQGQYMTARFKTSIGSWIGWYALVLILHAKNKEQGAT